MIKDVDQVRSDALEPVLWHIAHALAGPPLDRAGTAILAAAIADAVDAGYDVRLWGLGDYVTIRAFDPDHGGARSARVEIPAVHSDGCPCVVSLTYRVRPDEGTR